MTIEFSCRCGHRMKLPRKYAGIRVRCSRCQRPLQVPGAASLGGEVVDATVPPPLRFDAIDAKVVAAPTKFEIVDAKLEAPPPVPRRNAIDYRAAHPQRREEIFDRAEQERYWQNERWQRFRLYAVGIGVSLHLIEFTLVVLSVLSLYGSRVYTHFK